MIQIETQSFFDPYYYRLVYPVGVGFYVLKLKLHGLGKACKTSQNLFVDVNANEYMTLQNVLLSHANEMGSPSWEDLLSRIHSTPINLTLSFLANWTLSCLGEEEVVRRIEALKEAMRRNKAMGNTDCVPTISEWPWK